MRDNELDQVREKFDRIKGEIKDLKKADADYEGSNESEKDIKNLI
jgi:hypothetical protein